MRQELQVQQGRSVGAGRSPHCRGELLMSPPDINLDKRGENRAMPKTWSTAQTPCWRQSHFPLDKDGKEKGMVQKPKTKWGDVEFSETVEGSSGVKEPGGTHFTSPISSVNRPTVPLGRSRAWQAQTASPTEHYFSSAFHLLPHDILIKNLFYEELRGESRWIKNLPMDRFPTWSC